MKNIFKGLFIVIVTIIILFTCNNVFAVELNSKPELLAKMTSSENDIYSYELSLNLDNWLTGTDNNLLLIDGYEIYEKKDNEYTQVYSNDITNPNFETEKHLEEVTKGQIRKFVVRVYANDADGIKNYSEYSDEVILDHRGIATIKTMIAHGAGCFNITGENVNDYVCGGKHEGIGVYHVPANTEIKVKAVPADGYVFDAWYAFDEEENKISVIFQSIDIEYTFTAYESTEENPNTIAPAFVKGPYEVIEGSNQTYTIDSDSDARFRINAEYNLFKDGGEVYVDDEFVEPKYYDSEEGSTIITLKKEYLDTLNEGEHELFVLFNDYNYSLTTFTIANKPQKEEIITVTSNDVIIPPHTSVDSNKKDNNIMFYISILLLITIEISTALLLKK